jgi:hypothetical protein
MWMFGNLNCTLSIQRFGVSFGFVEHNLMLLVLE